MLSHQRPRAIPASCPESEDVSTMDHNVQLALLFEIPALILETTKLLNQFRIAREGDLREADVNRSASERPV